MKITFEMLPQFAIVEIKREDSTTKYSGVVKNTTSLKNVEPEWIAVICVNQNEFIEGRFSEINARDFKVSIEVSDVTQRNCLETGKEYPLLDALWGHLVELVFNPSLIWQRVKFEPQNGIAHYSDGSKETIEGGWDHEHCELCGQTISTFQNDDHYGYVNQRDNWLCESCYQKYVATKSLDFIKLNNVF